MEADAFDCSRLVLWTSLSGFPYIQLGIHVTSLTSLLRGAVIMVEAEYSLDWGSLGLRVWLGRLVDFIRGWSTGEVQNQSCSNGEFRGEQELVEVMLVAVETSG